MNELFAMLPLYKTFRNMLYINSDYFLNGHSKWYMYRFGNHDYLKNTGSYPPSWAKTIRNTDYRNWGRVLAEPKFDLSSYRQSYFEKCKDFNAERSFRTFEVHPSESSQNLEFLVSCFGQRQSFEPGYV